MECVIKGKFLANNEGEFNGNRYMNSLILVKDEKKGYSVEKVKVKEHRLEMSALTFGQDIEIHCQIKKSEYDNKVKIEVVY